MGLSIVTNLALHYDFVTEAMDRFSQVDIIYTEYAKVFDRVSKFLLVSKLRKMGVEDQWLV